MPSLREQKQVKENSNTPRMVLVLAIIFALGVVLFVILKSPSEGGPTIGTDETKTLPAKTTEYKSKSPKPAPTKTKNAPKQVENGPQFTPIALPTFWGTKLQSRLIFGDFLKKLQAGWDAKEFNAIQVEDAIQRAYEKSLFVDSLGLFKAKHQELNGEAFLRALIKWLGGMSRADLRLRRSGLEEATLEAKGSDWGRHALLRVWSKKHPLPAFMARDAERLLVDLFALGRIEIGENHPGFDLLFGEGLGSEFFPHSVFARKDARGVYVLRDQFSMVARERNDWASEAVVKHELTHAMLYSLSDDFESSRFVSEGLAEYLRLLQEGDGSEGFSDRRLKHEAAALLAVLDIMRVKGSDLSKLSFEALLSMKPATFYDLRQFGYLSAQMAMAYVDFQSVRGAIRAKSDRRLVADLKNVAWSDFEAFLKRTSKGGRPRKAISVRDRVLGTGDGDAEGFGHALNEAGILPAKGLTADLLELSHQGYRASISSASDFLSEKEAANTIFLSDTSEGMEAEFTYLQPVESEAFPISGSSLSVGSPRSFVENLHYELQTSTNKAIPFAGMHASLATTKTLKSFAPPITTLAGNVTFYNVPERLLRWQRANSVKDYRLILAFASKDEFTRDLIREAFKAQIDNLQGEAQTIFVEQTLARYYAEVLSTQNFGATSVLIIDLSKGESDAQVLASAMSQHLESKGLKDSVTIWDPQQSAAD